MPPPRRANDRDLALTIAVAFALGLHVVAARHSKGIWHFDEYFQVLEAMNYKLGRVAGRDLPWEFHDHIRSWLQPFLYWCVIAPARALGVVKPATWWGICNRISALLGWLSIITWAGSYRGWFRTVWANQLALATLVSCFFLPMLHARTSSENFSGTTFMLALGLLVRTTSLRPEEPPLSALGTLRAVGIGLLLGAAFELRYQVGIMVAGALAWCLWYRRIPRRALGCVLAGLVLALVLGWGVDAWGYHTWRVFPAVSYARINVGEDRAAAFGTSPWWAYFGMLLEFATTPLAVFLWICFGVFWATQPRSLLTWVTLPFFVVHCAIGHKEMRFLFPMLYFAPTIVALTVQSAYRALERERAGRGVRSVALSLVLVGLGAKNVFLLARATTLPLEAKFAAAERVDDIYIAGEKLFTVVVDSPFTFGNLPMLFYGRDESSWTKLPNVPALLEVLKQSESMPALVWIRVADYVALGDDLPSTCRIVWSSQEARGRLARWWQRVFGSQYLPRDDTRLLECRREA